MVAGQVEGIALVPLVVDPAIVPVDAVILAVGLS